jgi:hypothetical protein
VPASLVSSTRASRTRSLRREVCAWESCHPSPLLHHAADTQRDPDRARRSATAALPGECACRGSSGRHCQSSPRTSSEVSAAERCRPGVAYAIRTHCCGRPCSCDRLAAGEHHDQSRWASYVRRYCGRASTGNPLVWPWRARTIPSYETHGLRLYAGSARARIRSVRDPVRKRIPLGRATVTVGPPGTGVAASRRSRG